MGLDIKLDDVFQANPLHTTQQYERQGLDPRLARRFLRTQTLRPSEEVMLTSYIATSKWVPAERAVYASIVDGFTTVSEISAVTGLSEAEVTSTVSKLTSKGQIHIVKAE